MHPSIPIHFLLQADSEIAREKASRKMFMSLRLPSDFPYSVTQGPFSSSWIGTAPNSVS